MTQDQQPTEGTFIRQYCLKEKLSEDAFGRTWRAEHQVTHVEVTINLLHGRIVTGDASRDLRGLTGLRHPNLIGPLEYRTEILLPHIVYDPATGTRLDAFLGRGPIPWVNAAAIVAQVLDVLAYLHTQGFCYGHALPSSVLVTKDGEVMLADVGVQAVVDPDFLREWLALGSDVSPEALLTPQEDIAGAGELLWSAITGHQPQADLPAASELVAGVPPEIDEFIARCRARDPEKGFADAAAARAALLGIMQQNLAPGSAGDASSLASRSLAEMASQFVPLPPSEAAREQASDGAAGAAASQQRLPTAEDRVRSLQKELQASGGSPELEAELERLLEHHGQAELKAVSGMKGRAMLSSPDARATLTQVVYGGGCLIGFALLAWIANSYLQTVPLSWAVRTLLTYAALGAYVLIGIWVGAALGVTRTRIACYAVISDKEVLCHDEQKATPVQQIPAREIRAVTLLSGSEQAPQDSTVRIERWSGRCHVLDFAARARDHDKPWSVGGR